jgi:TPR repeat protein
MKRLPLAAAGLWATAHIVAPAGALAGPWEDGMAAYNRGDYMPAVQLFRPLAQKGNAKAQALLGVMYRRGQGMAKSSAHAFMWLSMASAGGDRRARAELREVSRSMSPQELAHAREMMQACEASNYRSCEY